MIETRTVTDSYPAPCCCGGCPCYGRCFDGSTAHGSYTSYIVDVVSGPASGGPVIFTGDLELIERHVLTRVSQCQYSVAISPMFGRFFIRGPGNQALISDCHSIPNHLYLFSDTLPGDDRLKELGPIVRPYDYPHVTAPGGQFHQRVFETSGNPTIGTGVVHYWGGTFEQCCPDGCNAPITGPMTLRVIDSLGGQIYSPMILPKVASYLNTTIPTDPNDRTLDDFVPGWGSSVDQPQIYFQNVSAIGSNWRLRAWSPVVGAGVYTLDSQYATAAGWVRNTIQMNWRECSPFRSGVTLNLRDADGIVRSRQVVFESTETPGESVCEAVLP
jgi:hypothetical protein